MKKFQIGDSNISALRYLDDMSVLCIAMYNGDIQMFDYYKHTIRATFTGHKNGIVVDLHWSFFGKYICSVGDRKVLIWDAFNAEVMNSLEGLTAPAVAVCIADTEKKLFVGAVDKTVRIWQSITFELLQGMCAFCFHMLVCMCVKICSTFSFNTSHFCILRYGMKLS